MFKKSLTILSIASAFYLQAQDVSIIRNSVDVYSANPLTGSAKFNAMAGSMGALGGDLSAINTNPASVGVFITGNISGTLAINNSNNSGFRTTSPRNTNPNMTQPPQNSNPSRFRSVPRQEPRQYEAPRQEPRRNDWGGSSNSGGGFRSGGSSSGSSNSGGGFRSGGFR